MKYSILIVPDELPEDRLSGIFSQYLQGEDDEDDAESIQPPPKEIAAIKKIETLSKKFLQAFPLFVGKNPNYKDIGQYYDLTREEARLQFWSFYVRPKEATNTDIVLTFSPDSILVNLENYFPNTKSRKNFDTKTLRHIFDFLKGEGFGRVFILENAGNNPDQGPSPVSSFEEMIADYDSCALKRFKAIYASPLRPIDWAYRIWFWLINFLVIGAFIFITGESLTHSRLIIGTDTSKTHFLVNGFVTNKAGRFLLPEFEATGTMYGTTKQVKVPIYKDDIGLINRGVPFPFYQTNLPEMPLVSKPHHENMSPYIDVFGYPINWKWGMNSLFWGMYVYLIKKHWKETPIGRRANHRTAAKISGTFALGIGAALIMILIGK